MGKGSIGQGIDKFLEGYSSNNTKRMYQNSLNGYFKHIGVDSNTYFNQKRDYEEDIRGFHVAIKDKYAPKSVRLKISVVKSFLIENEVELSQRFWRSISRKTRGSRALTLDKVPTNAELKSILTHTSGKGTALFLMLASSGMRIGEASQIKVSDVDLTSDPPRINIRGGYTKTGNSRFTFISTESREAIHEWLKIRDDYLKTSVGRSSKYKKSSDDDRLFPFETATARFMWKSAIEKAGLDGRDAHTGRYEIHIHVLRKFFRTQMATKIPRDIVEALMGHEGYLTEVYRRYSVKQLAEFYLKAENTVTVFRDQNGVKRLRKEIDTKMEGYDDLIERQAIKIKDLEGKLVEYEQSKELELGKIVTVILDGPVGKEFEERIMAGIKQLKTR